VQEGTDAH
jgi:predicted secreted acid phosphatase